MDDDEIYTCAVCRADECCDTELDVCDRCGKLFHPKSCGDGENKYDLCWNCFDILNFTA